MHILIIEPNESNTPVLRELLERLSVQADLQIKEFGQTVEDCGDPKQEIITFPGLEIRIREQTVYRDSILVPMSHYEFFTLCYLARHPDWVFSKQQIYEAVWDDPDGDGNAIVTNVISQIRKKLNPDDPTHGYIRTIVNSGYKFVKDLSI